MIFMKKHEGLKEEILNNLEKNISTRGILLILKKTGKFKTLTHSTVLRYLNLLLKQGKVNQIKLDSEKNNWILWKRV
jgi:Fe2+ or Zn2+ uptake regulation protein